MLTIWFLITGTLLLLMVLIGTVLKRLPISTAIIYLLIGVALGPYGVGYLRIDPLASAAALEHISEIAVLISLFTVGLKLRVSVFDRAWRLTLRLAGWTMLMTIALITAFAIPTLNMPLGVALLLAAIFAPTDPVLASDVQVYDASDRDRVRFGLTGEGGLNDGIAFPFVMLGLGMMGLHDLGEGGVDWLWRDVLWPITVGVTSGWLCGYLVGHWVIYLRRVHQEALGLEEFLALGLIAFSYGVALLINSYGFLAVFAAGLGLRRIVRNPVVDAMTSVSTQLQQEHPEKLPVDQPSVMPAHMATALVDFNAQLERIVEITVVVILGSMISASSFTPKILWFAVLLFFFVRPIAVWLGLLGSNTPRTQRLLIAWFGIRGLGSIYYLMYAINHGLPAATAASLIPLVFGVVAISIFIHGVSATPLMDRYHLRFGNKRSG